MTQPAPPVETHPYEHLADKAQKTAATTDPHPILITLTRTWHFRDIPPEQFPSSHFLISGGSILFASIQAPLRVCLIYHKARGEWLLPKGRKDRGENVTDAAVRETSEETGYPCELLPLDMVTRAPAAGAQTTDAAMAVHGSEEPFMVTLRRTQEGGVQLLSWFASVCTEGAEKGVRSGLQTEVEDYESAFFEVQEAMRVATFEVDRVVIARAVELVRGTYPSARDILEGVQQLCRL